MVSWILTSNERIEIKSDEFSFGTFLSLVVGSERPKKSRAKYFEFAISNLVSSN